MTSGSVLVILGTGRDDSNTLKALKSHLPYSGYDLIELHKHKITPYLYQQNKPDDDFLKIADLMASADIIVFATPVYWYAMSGAMKNFFDRFTDLMTTSKAVGRSLKGKKTFLFSTGSDKVLPEGFEVPFKRTSDYFEMEYKGSLYFSIND